MGSKKEKFRISEWQLGWILCVDSSFYFRFHSWKLFFKLLFTIKHWCEICYCTKTDSQRVREDINALCTWRCHCCGPVSDVDSTPFWLMMKSLNYCPKCCWSSRVPLCSVRVTEASFGNKYGLCLLAGDPRLLLLSQVTSEVVCKDMEKVRFYNGKSKRSVLKMSEYATTGEMLREYDATLLWNFRSAF